MKQNLQALLAATFLTVSGITAEEPGQKPATSTQQQPTKAQVNALFDAIQENDSAAVEKILKETPSAVHWREPERNGTPLMLAAAYGRTNIAGILLDKGSEINARDNNGVTALLYAATKPKNDLIVLALIQKGADVNMAGTLITPKGRKVVGVTPLMMAVYHQNVTITKALLDKEADIWAKTSTGMTAIYIAERAANPDIIKLLRLKMNTVKLNTPTQKYA